MGFFMKKNVKNLNMEKAYEELKKDKDIVLIDVRNADEYKGGHIRKSINVPLSNIAALPGIVPDKEAHIFVYCLSGARSARACDALDKMGYKDLTNIGGIMSWTHELEK